MRDPFGFISYRVGPSPNVIISTVWWSLAIILVVTVGVQAGTSGWQALKVALGKDTDTPAATSSTGEYKVDEAISEDAGGLSTFEATPYATSEEPTGASGQGLPQMPDTDKSAPSAL